jgi:hypothetical protein
VGIDRHCHCKCIALRYDVTIDDMNFRPYSSEAVQRLLATAWASLSPNSLWRPEEAEPSSHRLLQIRRRQKICNATARGACAEDCLELLHPHSARSRTLAVASQLLAPFAQASPRCVFAFSSNPRSPVHLPPTGYSVADDLWVPATADSPGSIQRSWIRLVPDKRLPPIPAPPLLEETT